MGKISTMHTPVLYRQHDVVFGDARVLVGYWRDEVPLRTLTFAEILTGRAPRAHLVMPELSDAEITPVAQGGLGRPPLIWIIDDVGVSHVTRYTLSDAFTEVLLPNYRLEQLQAAEERYERIMQHIDGHSEEHIRAVVQYREMLMACYGPRN